MLWRSAFIAALHSFLYGYAMSSLGPTLVEESKGSILHDLDLSDFLQQLGTGVMIVGGLIGSLCSSYPVAKFGPRRVLTFTCLLWIIGGGVSVIVSVPALMVGRFIAGLGLGLSSAIVPVYLSDIAQDANRGVVTSLCQLMITIGILVAGLVAYGFVDHLAHGWRPLLAGVAALGCLGLVTHPFMVDSPSHLVRTGQHDAAKRALSELRGKPLPGDPARDYAVNNSHGHATPIALSAAPGHEDSQFDPEVEAEYAALLAVAERERALPELSWGEVFSAANKRALIIGFGLMFLQPMTGINAVIFYSTKIFKFAGLEKAILGTVLVGVINVVMTIVSMALVERAGRRKLLLGGTALCVAALAALASVLLAMKDKGADPDASTGGAGYAAVAGVLLYIIGFAVGMGAVCWVVMGEVMLPRVRNKAYSLFVAESWAFNLLIAMTTLSTINGLGGGSSDDQQRHGVAWLFVIFGCFCAVALAFIAKFIPETKGMSNAAIDDMINGRRPRSSSHHEDHHPVLTA